MQSWQTSWILALSLLGLSDRSAELQQRRRGVRVDDPSAGTSWGTSTVVTYLCPGEALGSVDLLRDDLSTWKAKKENKAKLLVAGSAFEYP